MDLLATDLAGKLKVVKIDTEQYPTFGTSILSALLLHPPFVLMPWHRDGSGSSRTRPYGWSFGGSWARLILQLWSFPRRT